MSRPPDAGGVRPVDGADVPDDEGRRLRTVVFDVGEVLIDESRVWRVWAGLLGVSEATLMAVLGAAVVQGEDHRAAFSHVAPNVDFEQLLDEHERLYGGFRPEDLYPDVRRCLADVGALGLRVVLAGNQPRLRAEQLRALELPCDDVVTSEELGAAKPDPAFFSAVLERCGSRPTEVLYVGDRVDNDVVPATDAGMHVCWLRRGPWGRLQDVPDALDPSIVLEGLGELPVLLADWTGREPVGGAA